MANVMEIILKATDNASAALAQARDGVKKFSDEYENTAKKSEIIGDKLAGSIRAAGVAFVAAGAGIELLARKQGELSESTDKIAAAYGTTSDAIADMALRVSGAGDDIGETLQIIGLGVKQNLEGSTLENYANYWDMVGDAAGESGIALAEAARSLSAYGIEASNISDSAGAFGYVMEETNSTISEFLDTCQKAVPIAEDLGITIDEMAVIYGELTDRGYSGKKITAELTQAYADATMEAKDYTQAIDDLTRALRDLNEDQSDTERALRGAELDLKQARIDYEELLAKGPDTGKAGESAAQYASKVEEQKLHLEELTAQLKEANAKYAEEQAAEPAEGKEKSYAAKLERDRVKIKQIQQEIIEAKLEYDELLAAGPKKGEAGQSQEEYNIEVEKSKLRIEDLTDRIDDLKTRQEDNNKTIADGTTQLSIYNNKIDDTRTAKEKFIDALGIENDKITNAEQITSEYNGTVEEMASIHDANLTKGQEYTSYLEELAYKHRDVIASASEFAPAMIGVGTIMVGLPDIINGANKAFNFLTDKGIGGLVAKIPLIGSLAGGVGPSLIGMIVPWGVLVAAGLVTLYAAWQTNFMGIQDVVAGAKEWIGSRLDGIKQSLSDLGEKIAPSIDKLKSAFGELFGAIDNLWQKFTGGIGIVDSVKAAFDLLGRIIDVLGSQFFAGLTIWIDKTIGLLTWLVEGVTKVVDWFSRLAENPVVKFFIDALSGASKLSTAIMNELFPATQKGVEGFDKLYTQGSEDNTKLVESTTKSVEQQTTDLTKLINKQQDTGTSSTELANTHGQAMDKMASDTNAMVQKTTQYLLDYKAGLESGKIGIMDPTTGEIVHKKNAAGDPENYNPGNSSTWTTLHGSGYDLYDPVGKNPEYDWGELSQQIAQGITSGVQALNTNQFGYSWEDATGTKHNANFDFMSADQKRGMDITASGWASWKYDEKQELWENEVGVSGGGNPYLTKKFWQALSTYVQGMEFPAESSDAQNSQTKAVAQNADVLQQNAAVVEQSTNNVEKLTSSTKATTVAQNVWNATMSETPSVLGKSSNHLSGWNTDILTNTKTMTAGSLGSVGEMNTGVTSDFMSMSAVSSSSSSEILKNVEAMFAGVEKMSTISADATVTACENCETAANAAVATQQVCNQQVSVFSGGLNCAGITPGSGLGFSNSSWTTNTSYQYTPRNMFNWPWMAEGGTVTSGGMAVVGERGKEVVSLPKGASVTPLKNTGGGGEVHLHIGTLVADRAGLMRLWKELSKIRIMDDTRKGVSI